MENLFLKGTRIRTSNRFMCCMFDRGSNSTSPSYDPNADMQAHSSAHKRTVVEHESYLSKDQLKDLRRVQHERVEIAKRKQLGLEVKQSLGVRMDGSMFDE